MTHTDIINNIIKKFGYKSYLEIGTQQKNNNFEKIECENKICIDPDPTSDADLHLTSDLFYFKNKENFDIIFIDGLHENSQVWRDMMNSFMSLNDNGTIIVHDLLPTDELMQKVPRETKIWTGDGWKSWVKCRKVNDDLEMFVVDTDHGCGILRKGLGEQLETTLALTYENFEENKQEWMNIISVEDFYKWLEND